MLVLRWLNELILGSRLNSVTLLALLVTEAPCFYYYYHNDEYGKEECRRDVVVR